MTFQFCNFLGLESTLLSELHHIHEPMCLNTTLLGQSTGLQGLQWLGGQCLVWGRQDQLSWKTGIYQNLRCWLSTYSYLLVIKRLPPLTQIGTNHYTDQTISCPMAGFCLTQHLTASVPWFPLKIKKLNMKHILNIRAHYLEVLKHLAMCTVQALHVNSQRKISSMFQACVWAWFTTV